MSADRFDRQVNAEQITTRDRLASSLLDAERVFSGRTQLDRAEHFADCLIADGWAPPADLPATLATVDDVAKVCEAAGLEPVTDETGKWVDVGVVFCAMGTARSETVVRVYDYGDRVYGYSGVAGGLRRQVAEIHCDMPGAVLLTAIQAVRSSS